MGDAELEDGLRIARVRAKLIWKRVKAIDLEDLIAEAYLGVAEALNKYDPEKGSSFQTYVNNVVGWRLQDALRASAGCRDFNQQIRWCGLSEAMKVPSMLDLEEQLLWKERRQLLFMESDRLLHPRERMIIDLRFSHGMTYLEIARIIGVSKPRACTICGRALDRLDYVFKESGNGKKRKRNGHNGGNPRSLGVDANHGGLDNHPC